jgi:hypothetical protein
VIDGKLPGLSGRTSGSVDALGWVDAHAHVADVTWLENSASETPPPGGPSPLVTRTRNVLFWNSHLLSWAWLPQLGLPQPDWPLVALPQVAALEVDRATGELTPQAQAPQLREIVGAEHSPFLQLAGATLAQSPEGHLALMAPAMPVRATWIVTGLQPNGALLAGHPAHLAAFNPAPSASAGTSRGAKGVTDSGGREAETITLTLSVPTPTPSAAGTAAGGGQHDGLVLRLGSIRRSIALNAAHSPTSVSVVACFGASDRVLRGRLAVIGGARGGNGVVGAVLDGVSIDPAPAPQAASCAR